MLTLACPTCGFVAGYDPETGKEVWRRNTSADFDVPQSFFGVGSAPVLDDGRLIVQVGAHLNSNVVAFDAATGNTLWENGGEKTWNGVLMKGWPGDRNYQWTGVEKSASYSTPVAATIHGTPELDVDELRTFLLGHLARHEVPKYIFTTPEPLPRTATGKLFKRQLRDESVAQLSN